MACSSASARGAPRQKCEPAPNHRWRRSPVAGRPGSKPPSRRVAHHRSTTTRSSARSRTPSISVGRTTRRRVARLGVVMRRPSATTVVEPAPLRRVRLEQARIGQLADDPRQRTADRARAGEEERGGQGPRVVERCVLLRQPTHDRVATSPQHGRTRRRPAPRRAPRAPAVAAASSKVRVRHVTIDSMASLASRSTDGGVSGSSPTTAPITAADTSRASRTTSTSSPSRSRAAAPATMGWAAASQTSRTTRGEKRSARVCLRPRVVVALHVEQHPVAEHRGPECSGRPRAVLGEGLGVGEHPSCRTAGLPRARRRRARVPDSASRHGRVDDAGHDGVCRADQP